MRITTIFFDLDDTLYPSRAGLWKAIKERMNDYMRAHLRIAENEIPKLREKYFLQYGTTLRGLQAHHNIDAQEFLAYVHDLPLKNYLTADPIQRSIIASLSTRNLIFTNADMPHAQRVLATLELGDLFRTIVDVNAVAPYCKPMPESFDIAMKASGETDPSRCVMIDDLVRTTRAARDVGMCSILYGTALANGDANAQFGDWEELPWDLAELVMEDNRAIIGALIFLGLIVGANFVMYAIARGATRPNKKSFLETLGKSLAQPMQKKDDSLDELHRRIQALDQAGKDPPQDSG